MTFCFAVAIPTFIEQIGLILILNFFLDNIIQKYPKKVNMHFILDIIIISLVIIIPFETISYIIYRIKKQLNFTDIAWPLGFILLATIFYKMIDDINYISNFANTNISYIKIRDIMFWLVIIWGARLFYHLLIRNLNIKDDRYNNLTKDWQKFYELQVFLKIFLVQGLITTIIILPALASIKSNTKANIFSYIFIITWIAGFIIEALADFQLINFLKTAKKNDVLTDGIWKYSRHPNYLGELIMWWSIFAISLSGSYQNLITIFGPILLTYIIIFKSGINIINKEFIKNKKYQEYCKNTAKLIPLIF